MQKDFAETHRIQMNLFKMMNLSWLILVSISVCWMVFLISGTKIRKLYQVFSTLKLQETRILNLGKHLSLGKSE